MESDDYNITSLRQLLRQFDNEYGTNRLPPQTFAALPAIPFRKEADDNERCTICLDVYKDNETVMRLPCSHLFHGHCVTEWFKTSKSCPLCRREVVI